MEKTTIRLNQIGPDGLRLSYDLDREWLEQAFAGVEIALGPQGVHADIGLEKMGQDVLASGTMRGSIEVPCARCLEPARIDVGNKIRMTFGNEEETDEERLLDDVDFTAFDGELIDLGELLREQLLLAIPMTSLCRQDCKGLCPHCGIDRNQETCDCQPLHDPRLEALRGLKLS